MIAYESDRCAIIQGRAVETMRAMFADKSVDAIITDPPYSAHTHAKFGVERRTDGSPPRGELEFPPVTLETIAELAREFVRIARGWIVVFCDDRVVSDWGRAIEAAGGRWVRTGAWVKTSYMPQMTGDRPATAHEQIVIGHAVGKSMEWGGAGHAALWRGPRAQSRVHPNQKPEWLMQALLGLFVPAGGTALDPFFGSGSTGVAALRTERMVGESPMGTTCDKCAKKQVAEWSPPLPERVSVFGIEADPRWIAEAVARIDPLARALTQVQGAMHD